MRGPDGTVLDSIPNDHAPHCLQLPRTPFGRRVSMIVGDRVLRLALRPCDVRRLRRIARDEDRPIGPHALRGIRVRAVRDVTVGTLTLTLAMAVTGAVSLRTGTWDELVGDPMRVQVAAGGILLDGARPARGRAGHAWHQPLRPPQAAGPHDAARERCRSLTVGSPQRHRVSMRVGFRRRARSRRCLRGERTTPPHQAMP